MSREKKRFRQDFKHLLQSTSQSSRSSSYGSDQSHKLVNEQKQEEESDDDEEVVILKSPNRKRERELINIIINDSSENNQAVSPKAKREKATSAPLNLSLKIVVVVRGDITERIYKTWLIQLPKKLTAYNIQFTKQYSGEQDCIIVAAPTCSYNTFAAWLGPQSIDDSVIIVSSEWMIQAIKHSTIPPFDEYRIHPNIQPSTSTGQQIPGAEDAEVNDEDGKSLTRKKSSFIPSYACITTGDYKTLNPNKYITDILEELQQIYELCGDEWRALGYKKCIGTLKQLPRITHIDQLKGVRGVGDSIRDKIQEILTTGKLTKLKYFQDDPKIRSMVQLSKIWGVGEKTALKLMKQGFKSIQDLREKAQGNVLTYQQKIGLKYYEEFQKKIPRAEIEEILNIVHQHCSRIFTQFECQVCGSYRRGKPQSGDIDILITPSPSEGGDESFRADSIVRLVQSLTEVGLLTDHLTLPEQFLSSILIKELKKKQQHPASDFSSFSELNPLDGATAIACRASYMGVCQLAQEKSLHRRIDIKIYPRSMYAFALLYFTGSDHFNRSMRYYAKRRGYSLSDKELVYEQRIRRFPSTHEIGEKIPCHTEAEIFTALGLPYKAPNERNVFDIDHLFTDQEKAEEFRLLSDHRDDDYHSSDSDH